MAKISKVLRSLEDNGLLFMCPGCNMFHSIKYGEGSGPRWSWNNDVDKPTFRPSILVNYYRMSEEGKEMLRQKILPPNGRYPGTEEVCHSFVTDGIIQFLRDCTHDLKNQTVPLQELDDEE